MRFTHSKDWNNYIAHGTTKTLSNFQRYREQGQKHESRIYMFFDNAKYCTMKMMSGLVCDGDFNTASMNLRKFHSIYFPDEDFYNCNIFPEEWIEVFLSDGQKLQSEDIGQQEKKIQPYTPVCTKAELKKMLQGNVKSSLYSDIPAQTDNHLDTEALKRELQSYRALYGNRPFSRYTMQTGEFERNEAGGSKGFRIGTNTKKVIFICLNF